MEILKVKDWIDSKNKQFTPKKREFGHITECVRINDNREFASGRLLYRGVFNISNQKRYICVFIDYMHGDLIHVRLAGLMEDMELQTQISINIPINSVEKYIDVIIPRVQLKAAMILVPIT